MAASHLVVWALQEKGKLASALRTTSVFYTPLLLLPSPLSRAPPCSQKPDECHTLSTLMEMSSYYFFEAVFLEPVQELMFLD